MFFDIVTMTFQSQDTEPPSYRVLTDEYYGALLDGRGQGNTIELDPLTQGPVLVPIPGPSWQELQAPIEAAWRASEMPRAQQNVTAIEYGEEDIPGTTQQWQKYWLALRKWTADNADFPDSTKRPVAPT
ncbi:MAG: hypothetical protein WBI95_04075 [Pseudomonas veronii]|uniref:hypothetical protein n=1 Tax=Pseudomonas veronii TaxID=76761 RepID=UPI000A439AA9|nr:hypothetical protein [Pseudomonas veronii]